MAGYFSLLAFWIGGTRAIFVAPPVSTVPSVSLTGQSTASEQLTGQATSATDLTGQQ